MISVTSTILLKSSSKELFAFLGTLEGIKQCFNYKKVKRLAINEDRIEFILRRGAVFKFKLGEITDTYIQIDSRKDVPFFSAIRFEIQPKSENESEVSVHLETDTSPVIDFTFERPANLWVEAIVQNLDELFNA